MKRTFFLKGIRLCTVVAALFCVGLTAHVLPAPAAEQPSQIRAEDCPPAFHCDDTSWGG
ncbi:hypothetical protein [Streptomyces shenzhenensis]|uniref:hypothetical protein n=1 Tax=Streptomyces shenzhenensis TaxID=943815 RepID=UPI0015F014CC|nr:hypothetical protein [Streptomyces shenzhenensis]